MRHLTCLARELCNGSFENIPPVPLCHATSNTQRPKEKRWQQRVCFHVSKEGHGSSKGCGQCSCEKIVGRFSELDRRFYMYIRTGTCRPAQLYCLTSITQGQCVMSSCVICQASHVCLECWRQWFHETSESVFISDHGSAQWKFKCMALLNKN